MSPFDILGAIAGVAAVTFMYWRAVRPTPPPPSRVYTTDPAHDPQPV